MVKENQTIELVSQDDLKGYSTFHLINCTINIIDFIGMFEFNVHLIIENCIINNFKIHSCWFINGLILKNSIIHNYIDYQMGGHNNKPIILEGNVFSDFLNFFDCQFESIIVLKSNVFVKGTNLLGNKGEGFENRFVEGWLVENNVGDVSVNGVNI